LNTKLLHGRSGWTPAGLFWTEKKDLLLVKKKKKELRQFTSRNSQRLWMGTKKPTSFIPG